MLLFEVWVILFYFFLGGGWRGLDETLFYSTGMKKNKKQRFNTRTDRSVNLLEIEKEGKSSNKH